MRRLQGNLQINRHLCPLALAIAATFGIAAVARAAAGDPLGPSFVVYPQTMPNQISPVIARNSSGEFVIAWDDLNSGSIYGRRFAKDGSPLDGGFQVSKPPSGSSDGSPSVAIDDAGDFVVSWTRYDSSNSTLPLVQIQAFTSSGAVAGSAFNVESPAADEAEFGAGVAMDSAGDFVVAFRRAEIRVDRATTHKAGPYNHDSALVYLADNVVAARRFSVTGTPIDAEPLVVASRVAVAGSLFHYFLPNRTPFIAGGDLVSSDPIYGITVAMDGTGDFVVAWLGYTGGYAGAGLATYYIPAAAVAGANVSTVFARSYDQHGNPRHQPQAVTRSMALEAESSTLGREIASLPSVAMDGAGDYVVAWASYVSLGPDNQVDVLARQFSADGKAESDTVKIGNPSMSRRSPTVASDSSGNFVIALTDPLYGVVYAQRFAKGGTALGSVITVSNSSNYTPAIAADADGDFAICWINSYYGLEIEARLFLGS